LVAVQVYWSLLLHKLAVTITPTLFSFAHADPEATQ